jgi:uncharacterized membrane protein
MIWVALLFLPPLVLPSGSVSDLSGVVGYSDNEVVIKDMSFPWNVVYSIGDQLCHQKSERSLFLNGNEMPFCTRCTAIFLGLACGLGFMVLYSIELKRNFLCNIHFTCPLGIMDRATFGLWESIKSFEFTGFPAECYVGCPWNNIR